MRGPPGCGAGLVQLCSRLYLSAGAGVPCVVVLAIVTTLGMFMIFFAVAFVVNVRGTLINLPAFRTCNGIRFTLSHSPKLVLVTLYNVRMEVLWSLLTCFGLVLLVGFSLLLGLFGKESPSRDLFAAALVLAGVVTLLALLGRWAFDPRTRFAHIVPQLARMKTGMMFDTAAHSYSRQATKIGLEMYQKGFISKDDLEGTSPKLLLCIPSVVIFRSLVRSARPECRGLVLSNGFDEVTYFEEEKSVVLLDTFFKLRDLVRALNLSEDEQNLITQKLMNYDVAIVQEERSRKEKIWRIIAEINGMVLIGNAVDTWREWTNTWVQDLQREAENPFINPNILEVRATNGAMMIRSAKAGLAQDIKQLVQQKADVDRPSPRNGRTPLIVAAQEGHVCAVDELLKGNAKVDLICEGNVTALHFATFNGSSDIVTKLLERKANVECEDKLQRRPLHLAAEAGHTVVAGLLIANKAMLNAVDDHEATPLMIAIANGNPELVRVLVQSGCQLDCMDFRGWAPLMYAAAFATIDCLICLLEARAPLELRKEGCGTALHLAAHRGSTEVIEVLLRSRANTQVKDHQGFTALELARRYGNEDAVAVLTETAPTTGLGTENLAPTSYPADPLSVV